MVRLRPALTVDSYAKLNLYLAVLNKRKDNYHNIETIFEKIDLCDKIIFSNRPDKKITIACDSADIPLNGSNLAYKAARLLQNSFKSDKGVDIRIIKRIPAGSGLGGGSSNAASVLKGLNKLWGLGLSRKRLVAYAKKIGADVPFFIYDTSFAQGFGRGDEIRQLKRLKQRKFWHILVVPKLKVSTPLIYRKWDSYSRRDRSVLTMPEDNVNILCLALRKNNFSLLGQSLFNGLERIAAGIYPEIKQIRERFFDLGLRAILMSGSGSAVFGLARSRKEAISLGGKLRRNRIWQVFVTRTL